MDELNIDFHHDRSRRLFGEPLTSEQLNNDLESHADTVLQALRDEFMSVAAAAQAVPEGSVRNYLLYGVGRRVSMILHSLETLFNIVPNQRKEPLREDEGKHVTRDLNVIYINMVGVVDNLAWAAFHHRAPDILQRLSPTQVGLFTRALNRTEQLQGLSRELEGYRVWFDELRLRRDPAAHRVPLYLPPALLGPAEQEEYAALTERAKEAVAREDWEGWNAIMDQQRRLGRLAPIFVHSLEDPFYRFYPTIPEDIGQIIKVVRTVLAALR